MATIFIKQCVKDKTKYAKQTRNLLQETLDFLSKSKKSIEDVRWVGDAKGNICMTWEEFARQISELDYLPRGRCAYLTENNTLDEVKGEKPVSYYPDDDGMMNRVAIDLTVASDEWFLRRFVHTRMSPQEPPRGIGSLYNESPEFWELIEVPVRNSPYLLESKNDVRLYATDNVKMARTITTLNSKPGEGDPKFKCYDDMERNQLRVNRNKFVTPKRKLEGF